MIKLEGASFVVKGGVACESKESFDITVNCRKGSYYESVNYGGEYIKISSLRARDVLIKGIFTEIENSTAKSIKAEGSLYIHDCQKIKRIHVTGDLVLYGCERVSKIFATGTIYVIHKPRSDKQRCSYGRATSNKITQIFLGSKPKDILSLNDCNIEGSFNVDPKIRRVDIHGNCSKISKISFQGTVYSQERRVVVVKRDAVFNGIVEGGTLIRLSP